LISLLGVKNIIKRQFDLDLRVGSVTMSEVIMRGGKIYYGSIPRGKEDFQFYFRGDGISIADKIIKDKISLNAHLNSSEIESKIEGVSCRLLPFLPIRGKILCLIVEPIVKIEDEDIIFKKFFDVLKKEGSLDRLKPLSILNHKRPWLSKFWKSEAQLNSGGNKIFQIYKSRFKVIFESILGTLFFKLNFSNPFVGKPSQYTERLLLQSDWIKMDGVLRLVLDITGDEKESILNILKIMYLEKKIFYGFHESPTAVMTCHLISYKGDNHSHFIDGSDGGLTMAANNLKKQKKEYLIKNDK